MISIKCLCFSTKDILYVQDILESTFCEVKAILRIKVNHILCYKKYVKCQSSINSLSKPSSFSSNHRWMEENLFNLPCET